MTSSKIYIKQGSDLHAPLFKELVSFIEKRKFKPPFGEFNTVPVSDLISDEEYNAIDKSLLDLFQLGPFAAFFGVPFSNYYRIQRMKRKKNIKKTLQYVRKYYNLYRSLKEQDYIVTNQQLKSFPWLFVSKELKLRLDGHHRSAVQKFLGRSHIPAMVITPRSFENQSPPETLKSLLKNQTALPDLPYEKYESS